MINGFKIYLGMSGFKKYSLRSCAFLFVALRSVLYPEKNSVADLPLFAIHDFGVSADKAYRVLFGGMIALAINKPPMIQATDTRTLNSAPNPAATPLACKVPSAL